MRKKTAITTPSRMRAIAYARVSTEKQVDEGVSLAAQETKLRAYAAAMDLDLVDVVVDSGVSAKTLDRPGLQRALAALKSRKAECLLVTKLDRLTRNVRDLGDLVEEYFPEGKSSLVSLGESVDTRTAGGRLVLHVLGSVAQWEREAIGERTSAAMQHMRAQGQHTGGHAPYGFRVGEDGIRLVECPAEQAVIARVRAAAEAGLSRRRIVAELARSGIVSRSGRPLGLTQVARILEAA